MASLRIVFAYANGLHRIMGCSTEEKPPALLGDVARISEVLAGTAKGQTMFDLVATKQRYLLYKERSLPGDV